MPKETWNTYFDPDAVVVLVVVVVVVVVVSVNRSYCSGLQNCLQSKISKLSQMIWFQERINVYFNEATGGRYVPRAVLMDLEPGDGFEK